MSIKQYAIGPIVHASGIPIPPLETSRNDKEFGNNIRRRRAVEAGENTYIPVTPCVHGHNLRYVASGACVQCSRKSSRKAKGYE